MDKWLQGVLTSGHTNPFNSEVDFSTNIDKVFIPGLSWMQGRKTIDDWVDRPGGGCIYISSCKSPLRNAFFTSSELPTTNRCNCDQGTYRRHLGYWCKRLLIIKTILLRESLSHKTGLITLNRSIRSGLYFIDPLAPNCRLSWRQVNQVPCFLFRQCIKFLCHSFLPKRVEASRCAWLQQTGRLQFLFSCFNFREWM